MPLFLRCVLSYDGRHSVALEHIIQCHAPLTIGQDSCLLGDLSKVSNDLLAAFSEAVDSVWNANIIAEVLY